MAYGIYWYLLEEVAAAMEPDCMMPSVTHSDAVWASICHCSTRVWQRISSTLASENLILLKTVSNRTQIDIPKLLKYRDEYSQKSGQSPDKICSDQIRVEIRSDNRSEQSRSEHNTPERAREKEQKSTMSTVDGVDPTLSAVKPKLPPVESSPRFDEWFGLWGSVRSTNNKIPAGHAWVSVVTPSNAEACFTCTRSYIAAHDGPNGFNPDNFLFVHAREGFAARWPPKARSPGERRKDMANEQFERRLLRDMGGKNAG
jgi:hypothetical protein